MRYLVPCECGQTVPASPGQAGQALRCTCDRLVKVPELRELRRLPEAPDVQAAPVVRKRWGALEVVFFAGLILTLVALVAAVVVAIGRARLGIYWTEQAQAEVDSTVIDAMGIDEILAAWVDMRRDGLGGKSPHAHMFGEADAERLSQWLRWLLLFAAPVGGLTIGIGARLWLDRRATSAKRS